ncbi:MAG: C40 family peptidase, partial [Bacteroidales bacterium]|nr:C40 family peptidase [Bacteroidales bacterium]
LENGIFQTAETGFNAQDALMTADKRQALTETERREALLKSAAQWLNTPYLWGGKSIFGTDCSGFTQTLYRIYGIQLPRDAKDQAGAGEAVIFLDEAKAADLLFFDNENEQLVHVVIYMRNSRIIHASGMVRIDTIDHQGIYRQDTKNYSHKLRLIRRMF